MNPYRFPLLLLLLPGIASPSDAQAPDAVHAVPQERAETQDRRAEEWQPSGRSTREKIADLKQELKREWPKNRTVRFVFHGHSVPAGYFKTPNVRRFDSYPALFHQRLCERYPTATIDVCVTAIGGENSLSGAKRFADDVLSLKPDVVFIDYALNDRRAGLGKARAAWQSMIRQCLDRDTLVVLLTPTPDSSEAIGDADSPLEKHSKQLRELAAAHRIPIVDSHAAFQKLVSEGRDIEDFLSQRNHPNRAGHGVVAQLLTERFTDEESTSLPPFESKLDTGDYAGSRDVIRPSDPTRFAGYEFLRNESSRRVWDRRSGWFATDAEVYQVSLGDKVIEAVVHPEFNDEETQYWVTCVGEALGRLPRFMLNDRYERFYLYKGNHALRGGVDGTAVHVGGLAAAIQQGWLEEVLMHEAAHTCLDPTIYQQSAYLEARQKDSGYASDDAKDHPDKEDVAETVIPWLIDRHRRDRVSAAYFEPIKERIIHRLAYFDELNWKL